MLNNFEIQGITCIATGDTHYFRQKFDSEMMEMYGDAKSVSTILKYTTLVHDPLWLMKNIDADLF